MARLYHTDLAELAWERYDKVTALASVPGTDCQRPGAGAQEQLDNRPDPRAREAYAAPCSTCPLLDKTSPLLALLSSLNSQLASMLHANAARCYMGERWKSHAPDGGLRLSFALLTDPPRGGGLGVHYRYCSVDCWPCLVLSLLSAPPGGGN